VVHCSSPKLIAVVTDCPMTDPLDDYLRTRSDRCPGCGFHIATQGCPCAGITARNTILPAVSAAHPDESARLESAIRRLAASGREFSANAPELRLLIAGIPAASRSGVVGSAFGRLSRAGVIKKVGIETSNLPSTKGHDIKKWRGAAA
jgi:hypothetical protein